MGGDGGGDFFRGAGAVDADEEAVGDELVVFFEGLLEVLAVFEDFFDAAFGDAGEAGVDWGVDEEGEVGFQEVGGGVEREGGGVDGGGVAVLVGGGAVPVAVADDDFVVREVVVDFGDVLDAVGDVEVFEGFGGERGGAGLDFADEFADFGVGGLGGGPDLAALVAEFLREQFALEAAAGTVEVFEYYKHFGPFV